MLQKKKQWGFLLLCFLAAFGFLAISHKSSPLYPMNDWVDVNCFFTVGKSMLHGMVPYRDLYEQKGPVLYFLYALAALISQRSFFGAYLIDSISYGLFLYFSGKCAQLYLGRRRLVYALVLILGALIPVSPAFAHGGSVELLCLWMLAYSLFSVNRAILGKTLLPSRDAFFIGCLCAMTLYIKFTIVGFFLGLALFVALWYLLWERKPLALLSVIGCFLGGIGAVSLPVFAYFLIHGALGDMFTVYFYNNLFLYPSQTPDRLQTIWLCFKYTFKANPSYTHLLPLGGLWLLFRCRRESRGFAAAALSFLGLVVGTYWGGRGYAYYGLIFSAFAVFGLIAAAKLLDLTRLSKLWQKLTGGHPAGAYACLAVLAAGLVLFSFQKSQNTYLIHYSKADMPQYRFAEKINQVEDPTLLNFGFLDGGFYFAADIVPTCKFFCTLNIPLAEMGEEQRRQVNEGLVDFVITQKYFLEDYGADPSLYEIIDTGEMYFEGIVRTYYLYRLKSLA